MPIPRRQFDLGVDSEVERWMQQIYPFLVGHRDLAYSVAELRDQFIKGLRPDDGPYRKFERALEVLVELGAVEVREVAGNPYLAFFREIDTTTWELKVKV